ncbi:MAG: hypothetical protein FWG21_00475 [Oscillospiraceae bacterium]|nr:hypothetical protein [Oscillospiraceae bacterium]
MSQNKDSEKTIFKAPSGDYEVTESKPVKRTATPNPKPPSRKPVTNSRQKAAPPPPNNAKKGKRKKRRGRKLWLLLLLLIPIVFVAAIYLVRDVDARIDDAVRNRLSYYKGPDEALAQLEPHSYVISTLDELIIYLTHPMLNEGDTIVVNDHFKVDCDETFNGYLRIGLINFECTRGSITFNGGTMVLASGREETIVMDGVSFVDTNLFIDAASVDLTWKEAPRSARINTKTLNGSPSLIENLVIPAPGGKMTIPITLQNISSSNQDDISIQFISPYFVFPGEATVVSVPAGGAITINVESIVAEGGRARIYAIGLDSSGQKVIEGYSDYIELLGGGYYSGDPHTHTAASYTKRGESTLEDNIYYAAQKGHSFIISVENDAFATQLSQETVDNIVGESDVFLQLTALETGRRNQLRHIMLYNYDSEVIPRSDYEVTYLRNYSPQNAIWLAQDEDPDVIVYIPHPFGYDMNITESVNNISTLYGITGIELLDQTAFSNFTEFLVTINVWNNINIYNRQRVFGIGASNNIYSEYVGSRYTKGFMTNLSEENIYAMLREGDMFASNGPELRFTLSDAKMGEDLYVGLGDTLTAKVYASSETPLTTVRIIRYDITGKWEDLSPDYVLDLDFTGKNIYEYEAVLPIEVATNLDRNGEVIVQDSIYRLEVRSESSPYYDDIGMAFGNPIWVTANGEKVGTSPAFTEVFYEEHPPTVDLYGFDINIDFINNFIQKKLDERMAEQFGGAQIYVMDNGDYYIIGDFTINALWANAKDDQIAAISYHRYNSNSLVDTVTVVTSVPSQLLRYVKTIYLLD